MAESNHHQQIAMAKKQQVVQTLTPKLNYNHHSNSVSQTMTKTSRVCQKNNIKIETMNKSGIW